MSPEAMNIMALLVPFVATVGLANGFTFWAVKWVIEKNTQEIEKVLYRNDEQTRVLEQRFNDFRVEVGERYVRYDEFFVSINRIKAILNRQEYRVLPGNGDDDAVE